jgi:site-specific DNA recombinase
LLLSDRQLAAPYILFGQADKRSDAMTPKRSTPKLRAAGYCRTSGEGQRDNTSIPIQNQRIEHFVQRQGWNFVGHYVDECKSGGKIAGREDFQRMMKDAANDKFDIIVPYDASRFARDGCDIIHNAKFLRNTYDVYVVDTRNTFDNLTKGNVIQNFVHAGLTEHERLSILARTISGRIERARAGLPWTGSYPVGRSFVWKDKKHKQGYWTINDRGRKLKEALERYDKGESLTDLAREFGLPGPQTITGAIRNGQLSGIYQLTISSDERDLDVDGLNEPIAIPKIPEIISPQLEKRVRERLHHNRSFTKRQVGKYLLSGFTYCGHCGYSLTGQTEGQSGYRYYRHVRCRCSYRGVRADMIEKAALDYLYSFFLDEPAYNEAVKAALPSDQDRKAAEKDLQRIENQIRAVDRQIQNLVKAVAKGADVSLLVSEQDRLKAEKQGLETRQDDLQETLDNMPDPAAVKQESRAWRTYLKWQIQNRNWRSIPYKAVQEYLHFLFSENPRKNGFGIFVSKQDDSWHITFQGRFRPAHALVDGKRTPVELLELQQEFERIRQRLKSPKKIEQLEKRYTQVKSALLEYTSVSERRRRLEKLVESAKGLQTCVDLTESKIERCKKRIDDLKPESGNELPILPADLVIQRFVIRKLRFLIETSSSRLSI